MVRRWHALGVAAVLSLAAWSPAFGQEQVLTEQAQPSYESLPVEVRIDLHRALVARRGLLRKLGAVPNSDGEVVLGEQAQRDAVSDAILLDMLRALRARAQLLEEMGELP